MLQPLRGRGRCLGQAGAGPQPRPEAGSGPRGRRGQRCQDPEKCNTLSFQEPLFTEDAILWSLVWVIFGGTVLGLIGVRVATQHSHERRYQQYNAFREKF